MASVLAPVLADDPSPLDGELVVPSSQPVRRGASKSAARRHPPRTTQRVLKPRLPKGPLVGEKLLWQIRRTPRVHLAGLCLVLLGLLTIALMSMLTLNLPVLASPQKLLPGSSFTYQPLLPMMLLLATALGYRLTLVGLGVWLVAGLAGVPVFAAGGGLGVLHSPGFGYWLALPPVVWGACTVMGWFFDKITRPWAWGWIALLLGGCVTLAWHSLGMIYGGVLAVATAAPWPILKSWWVGLSAWPFAYDLLLCVAAISLTRLTRAALWPLLY